MIHYHSLISSLHINHISLLLILLGPKYFLSHQLRLTRARVCKKLFEIGTEREFPLIRDVILPYMAGRHLLSWIA